MFAQTLKTLDGDGFVHREAQTVIPPRVDYSLTARGEKVAALLTPLLLWVGQHAEEILADTPDPAARPDLPVRTEGEQDKPMQSVAIR